MNTTVTRTEKLGEVTAVYVEKVDNPLANPAGLPTGSCLTPGSVDYGTSTLQKSAGFTSRNGTHHCTKLT